MPNEVSVPVGSAVRWIQTHDVFHTVTSTDSLDVRRPNGLFDASLSAPGQTFEYTFTKPGAYHFYCRPHADFMFGTVRVT